MANIVRCEMPDGTYRFKPFTVSDYRDFLLVRNDMNNKSPQEQTKLIDDLLLDYFEDYPKSWRPYLFMKVYTSSIGKTKLPVTFQCMKCEKNKQFLFNLHQEPLKNPVIEVAGLTIEFKFPDEILDDKSKLILDNIMTVQDENGKYNWEDVSEEDKIAVIDAIDMEALESLISQMSPINFKVNYGCCTKNTLHYNNLVDIFKLLLNPDEVFTFYQVNHMLVKNSYNLESIMGMIPIERSIALSLVEKDLKK